MSTLLQDLRFALRQLRKSPGFTMVAVATLALGIGVNTVIFSVVNGVLLRPLPFPQPDQLVTLHENKPNFKGGSVSYPNFRDWQKDNHTFSLMAISRSYAFSLTGIGQAEQLNGEFVSSDFFPILGVNAVVGRTFAQGEDEVGANPVALISAGLWRRKFSSAPEIAGKTITLDAREYTVVGVIPANFHLLIPGYRDADVFVPIGQWSNPLLQQRGAGLGIHGIGRLKPGVTVEQARADMESVSRNLTAAFPNADKGITADVVPLKQTMIGHVRPFLSVLMTAVGFVLLIACANVGNLLLVRSTARRREFAVRAALGASRSRVVRQLLTESVLLSLAGGALGLLLAAWGIRAVLQTLPTTLPRAEQVGLDLRVLFFTAGVSLIAGILFGLTPAWKTSQPDLQERLKEGGRGAGGPRHYTLGVFVTAEMALAVVLLIGAGLTIRSLMRLWSLDPGLDPHNVMTFGLSLPPSMVNAKPEAIRAAFYEFDAKVAAIPGVRGVSQVWGALPFDSDDEQLFWLDGQPKPANENDMDWAIDYIVEPDYLRIMGIPLQHGRFFTAQDNEHSPLVVVVDDVFAGKYFPHQDAVGKRIHLNQNPRLAEIVGVVSHVRQWGMDADDRQSLRSELYIPCMQMPDDFVAMAPSGSGVVVRSNQASAGLADAVRRVSGEMSNQQVIFGMQTMDSLIARSLASRQFLMILLVVFASLALVLASVGIYGVISYAVAQRVHEIGLRMALGARRFDILSLILSRGGKLALTGIVLGMAAAAGLTRLMSSLLYGVSTLDPITFAGMAILLMAIALAACFLPARRATKVDPAVALRCE
ncbi:MAG TPA: ABC transporter permease [Verrucomicrobiae bacterium]|nr:ABC transporter permease [Verrucomicrobiae bacterium]